MSLAAGGVGRRGIVTWLMPARLARKAPAKTLAVALAGASCSTNWHTSVGARLPAQPALVVVAGEVAARVRTAMVPWSSGQRLRAISAGASPLIRLSAKARPARSTGAAALRRAAEKSGRSG